MKIIGSACDNAETSGKMVKILLMGAINKKERLKNIISK